MNKRANADVACRLVGEYLDEAELPADSTFGHGEVVRTQVIANYQDAWVADESIKEFTVLLADGRIVAVRGHGLKQVPPTVSGESGSYGITVRTCNEDVFIALFKVHDVVGIFHGEIKADRRIA